MRVAIVVTAVMLTVVIMMVVVVWKIILLHEYHTSPQTRIASAFDDRGENKALVTMPS